MEELEIQLRQFLDDKVPLAEVCVRLNKSLSSVRRLLKKFGLKSYWCVQHDPSCTEKKCLYCDETKSIDQFPVSNTIKGITYYRRKCNKCYVASKADRRRGLSSWLTEYKKEQKCEICGNSDFRVLDFHHLGDKSFNIADAAKRGFAKSKTTKEIDKCQVLCSNCHRIETYEARQASKV